ncbi:MAG: helix-turn-helix domain-containing protein [Armatimonadetes bacterium]|nr:helix-turn-helix domain-containing protein [Armatimonadota bacterium]
MRAARAARGVSLADVQARTKISARFLAAFEEERFNDLPPFPYARGFLRTLARELDLDPEPLVARLAEVLGPGARTGADAWDRLTSAIEPAQPSSRLRRLAISTGVVVLLVGVALAADFAHRFREFSQPPPDSPPGQAQERPAPAAGPKAVIPTAPQPSTPGGSAPPSAAPAVAAAGDEGITVEVQALGRSWILVTTEAGTLFEGFITAGQTRRWQSTKVLTIRVGNAGAVILTVNGKIIGPLGRPGEVVDRTIRTDALP